MEGKEKKKRILPDNALRFCIDTYENDLSGRIYSKIQSQPLVFCNCSEMLIYSDYLLDERGYPQRFFEKRSFFGNQEGEKKGKTVHAYLADKEIEKQRGACGTFDVIIRSRRKAGWQGILCCGNGLFIEFWSEIELLNSICMELQKGNSANQVKLSL